MGERGPGKVDEIVTALAREIYNKVFRKVPVKPP